MKTIAIEEHLEIKAITDGINAAVGTASAPKVNPEMQTYMKNELPSPTVMQDITDERLPFMDKNEIDVQILSFGNASPQNLEPEYAIPLSQQANDELAKIVAQHPGRFAALAVLPVGDPNAAAQELERAVMQLGLKGVLLKGNYQNRYFDDPYFKPIFAMASQLDVPVYFHPSFVPETITNQYYSRGEWSDLVSGILSTAGFGWHIDVGIQVLRMVLSGIFDEYPNLKLISGHWGEMIPMFLERFDDEFNAYDTLKQPVSHYFRQNIYFSPSGILTDAQMKFMLDEVGADHVMYSVDYPYKTPTNTKDYMQHLQDQAILTTEEAEKIAYRNAENIFYLN